MVLKKILVTGANGQLGWELSQLAAKQPAYDFTFVDRTQLDLSKPATFEAIITQLSPDIIINTAAYTAVDKAETEKELANTVNAIAVHTLASIAKQKNIRFITYSTDYVFDGQSTIPYLPETKIDPINFYGFSKASGEQLALHENPATIVIRTSWVFSSHGNNFVKTMIRLMKEKTELKVVGDQLGRPTYARDLAQATFAMIEAINTGKKIEGIYHFANKGEATWYDFAAKIKAYAGLSCNLISITTAEFPTPAARPSYSVLDTTKLENDLGIDIPNWETALKECIQILS